MNITQFRKKPIEGVGKQPGEMVEIKAHDRFIPLQNFSNGKRQSVSPVSRLNGTFKFNKIHLKFHVEKSTMKGEREPNNNMN